MNYTLKYLPAARKNVDEIIEYLLQFYPGTMEKFTAELRQLIHGLQEHPFMYPVYHDFPIYRHIPVGDYIVFYIVNEADKTVEIHRILHGKRNIRTLLGNCRSISDQELE